MSAAMVMEDRPRVSWTTFMSCPAAKQQGGGAVAQVVQADGRQPGEVGEQVERVGDRGGVQRVPQLVGELEPAVGPGVSGCFFLLVLFLPPDGHVGDGVGVEGDGALAGVGLGGALDGIPAELGDLPADGGQGGVRGRCRGGAARSLRRGAVPGW